MDPPPATGRNACNGSTASASGASKVKQVAGSLPWPVGVGSVVYEIIDADRVYVIRHSMGGYGVWHL